MLMFLRLALFCFLFFSCRISSEEIVAQKVAQQTEAFRIQELKKCRESLYAKAEKIVDSLLLSEAKLTVEDSLARLKPFRPVEPVPIPALDSGEVKPLFETRVKPASPTGG